jgi:hypothetical protein
LKRGVKFWGVVVAAVAVGVIAWVVLRDRDAGLEIAASLPEIELEGMQEREDQEERLGVAVEEVRGVVAKVAPPESESEEPQPVEVEEEEPPAEGIYAFPRPGTKKIRVGIIVPEGFELPPGYVRHYQTTDGGEMLPAILMFHPIHPPADLRVPVPEDRIVPAELVPPGLAVELLEVPKNAYSPE